MRNKKCDYGNWSADGDIIRMDHYSGSLWGHEKEDEKTWEHAKAIGDQIKDACQELKLEVRAGIYEQGNKDRAETENKDL